MNYPSTINIEQENRSFLSDTLENILKQLSHSQGNGCLQVVYNSIVFFIHFNEGKLIYATNSLAPFERLERHLRRLSNQNRKLTDKTIIQQARRTFRDNLESYTQAPSDYKGIFWLSEQDYIDPQEAVTLLRRITREVFESLLCLPSPCRYKFIQNTQQLPELCKLDLISYIKQCRKRLGAWQAFSAKIWSSYQRPYLLTEKTNTIPNLNTEQNETICKLLKGLNFRQISAVIDRDELVVAKILYPSIMDNTIVIRDPKPPFDRLPKMAQSGDRMALIDDNLPISGGSTQIKSNIKDTFYTIEKNWKLACVDNRAQVGERIKTLLDDNLFTILTIADPMSAFAQLIEFQPDLILLDAEMPNLNGYELCSLLRNHLNFKDLPIVLLSEEDGLINSTKFRLAGATDRVTKPFTKSNLLNVILKYLQ